ncbi:hypothetical protein NDU88_001330 [Pleurodeles waltl]|uniref:Uncharacterized protein n=1 Tax=Pleurodeles waltl TaxID=8319 RepID=A0AAV7V9H6_PLEWA|nr:hypothetical protein NDU88_001330 [Pleurodeles waltl]
MWAAGGGFRIPLERGVWWATTGGSLGGRLGPRTPRVRSVRPRAQGARLGGIGRGAWTDESGRIGVAQAAASYRCLAVADGETWGPRGGETSRPLVLESLLGADSLVLCGMGKAEQRQTKLSFDGGRRRGAPRNHQLVR